MDETFIWQVGEYIADGHTISEAALFFQKSPSSIKKYLAKIRNKDNDCYNEILAEKIKLAQAKIELEGHKKGGSLGKRTRNLEYWQIEMYLNAFLSSGLYLEQFAKLAGIPKSTLYENFESLKNVNVDLHAKFRAYMSLPSHNYTLDRVFEEDLWKR